MLGDLLPFYERELGHLRHLAGEFAQTYPKIARRLQMEGEQCEDPQVERLFETFAFLTARVHQRLDDDYPEITEPLLDSICPDYLRPIPSTTILQVAIDANKPEISGKYWVPRHHRVNAPLQCKFRTCYDLELWPIEVKQARLTLTQNSEHLRRLTRAEAVIELELETLGGIPVAALKMDKLRFFLDGHPSLTNLLYELLFAELLEVRISDGTDNPDCTVTLPKGCLRPVGFDADEGTLDTESTAMPGYGALAGYFAFPENYMFAEISGLDHPKLLLPGFCLKIQFCLSRYGNTERHNRLLQTLDSQTFKLGCVPIVNLFQQAGDPIRLSYSQPIAVITVGGKEETLDYEIYSIDSLSRMKKQDSSDPSQPILPFYSAKHFSDEGGTDSYWHSTRRASTRKNDTGTEVEFSLVDRSFKTILPEAETLSAGLTCTNRNLPASIPFSETEGRAEGFTLENHTIFKRVHALRKPSQTLRPPASKGFQWKLISLLSHNQLLSLSQGKECLQEALELYNRNNSAAATRQIQGIVSVETRTITARILDQGVAMFARGTEVSMTFDEDRFSNANLFLFATILERFFAHFCAPQNFVTFRLLTKQRGEVASWPPRTGEAGWI